MKDSFIRRITRNDYINTIATKLLVTLIGVISSSIAKRFFGPAIEGDVGYIDSILTVVAVTANLGLYQPYPFYKRQGEIDVLSKFLNIFALQFVAYAVIGAALMLVTRSFVAGAVCLITPFQVLANQYSFLMMVEDVKYKNRTFFLARIINTLLLILAVLTLRPSVHISLAMILVGDIITILAALRFFGRFGNPVRADLSFFKKILPFGIVTMITTLLLTLNYKVDAIMLEWMGVQNTLRGFYQTGAGLAGYGWLISDAFREVLFSRTARDDATEEMVLSLKFNLYITVAILIAIAIFGKLIIRILFGAAYLPAYGVTLILLLGILSMSYFKLIGTLLLAQGRKRFYTLALLASVLVNIVCNLLAIPRWGIEGAAWASVLSYSVAGVAFLLYYTRISGVPLSRLFIFSREDIALLKSKLRRRK